MITNTINTIKIINTKYINRLFNLKIKHKKLSFVKLLFTTPFIFCALNISTAVAHYDLVEIYKLAEKNDVIIKQQYHLYKATQKDEYIERGQLLPQIDLTGSRGFTKINDITSPFKFYYKEYNLLLEQVLFDWEKWHRYLRTDPLITVAQKNWYQENQNLILRVSEAYFNILLAQDTQEFLEKEYEAINELYKESQARFDVGDITRADIDQVRADLDSITSDLYEARNNVANSKEILQEIINIPVPDLAKLNNSLKLPKLTPYNVNSWQKIAKIHNLNLQSAKANKDVAQHNISIAEAGYMPTVQLSARLRGTSQGRIVTNLVTPQRQFINTFRVGVDIESPNLNPYGTIAQNKKARYDYHKADQEYIETYRNISKLIEQQFREVLTTKKQISALNQSIIASQSALDATKASFDVGNRTFVFVLNRISDLYSAKRDHKNAIYRYILALLRLEDSAGRLTIKDLVAVNQMLVKHKFSKKGKYKTKAKITSKTKSKASTTKPMLKSKINSKQLSTDKPATPKLKPEIKSNTQPKNIPKTKPNTIPPIIYDSSEI